LECKQLETYTTIIFNNIGVDIFVSRSENKMHDLVGTQHQKQNPTRAVLSSPPNSQTHGA